MGINVAAHVRAVRPLRSNARARHGRHGRHGLPSAILSAIHSSNSVHDMHAVPRRHQQTEARTAHQHLTGTSNSLIEIDRQYSAGSHERIPIVLERAYQTRVWDGEGREYIDFSCTSLNHGHSHPHILAALSSQAATISHMSSLFHNSLFPNFMKRLCQIFRYDHIVPTLSHTQACELAVVLARRWGHHVKNIPNDRTRVITTRAHLACTTSHNESSSSVNVRHGGHAADCFDIIEYDDLQQLEASAKNKEACAFIVEGMQASGSTIVPKADYLKKAADICRNHDVLIIADEGHTGLGRTGQLLSIRPENIKPDAVILGQALGGGMFPLSAIVGTEKIVGRLRPDDCAQARAMAANPLACAVGMASLDVLETEKLAESADSMGHVLRHALSMKRKYPSDILKHVRGMGLLNVLVLNDVFEDGGTAGRVCLEMARNGVLATPTDGQAIRLSPPLNIRKEEIKQACLVIREALRSVSKLCRSSQQHNANASKT